MVRQSSLRILLTLAALLLSSSCYLYGIWKHVNESVYTGMRSLNASDYNVNLSFLEQYREGRFVVKNLYAAEPHNPFLIRPVYFVLSVPFAITNLPNPIAFHIIRLIVGAALLFCLFRWIAIYHHDPKVNLIAFLLLAFTSGVGFFVKAWIQHPLDLTVPESNLFLTLGEPPHFLSSLFLLLFGLTSLYLAIIKQPTAILIYFVCLLLLWFEHPYEAVVLAAVGFVNLILLSTNRMRLRGILGMIAVSLPAVLYYSHLRHLPVFASWSAQNVLKTPAPHILILGFLPLIIFAIGGIQILRRNPDHQRLLKFLAIWIVVQTLICYLPVPFQRRFVAGLQFPLAILAGIGLAQIRFWPTAFTFLILSTFSNGFVMWHQTRDLKQGLMPFYLPAEYLSAFDWLHHQEKDQIVLSGYVTGNFIPAYTGLTVYAGHFIQTPNVQQKKEQLAKFFQNPDRSFLSSNKIDYIFYGLEERHFNGEPLSAMFLKVYETKNIEIFDANRARKPSRK